MNEILKTEDAMGHQMMTAGMDPQYYWCELCSAYTGFRARKLTKQCDRTFRKVPQVEALRMGKHPSLGTDLVTMPRRLCKRDVGAYGWSGEGRPDDCLELVAQHTVQDLTAAVEHSDLALSISYADEEDPMGHGLGID